MASFLDKFKNAYENAYSMPFKNVSIFPKILEKKKTFSPEEKEHLTRKKFRWYVYYDYLNPETNQFERQTPVTLKVNRIKDFDQRLAKIKLIKKKLIEHLTAGNSPYKKKPEKGITILSALDFAMEQKKQENIADRTKKGYEKSVNALKEFIKKSGRSNAPVETADKKLLVQFISSLKVSNRTKNNYRSDLSAVFGVLVDHEYLQTNPVEKVKKQDTIPQIAFNYSEKDFEEIISYLEKEEPVMLMFIRLVSFQFWRPKENCRIKVKDVDLENRTVRAFVKQGKFKTKLIPNILFNDLQEYLKGASQEDLIFTPNGPGAWDRDLDGRRDYFTYRFRRLRNAGKWSNTEISIYDFRHYYTTKAFRSILNEEGNEDKTLQILMKITGHSTITAIKKYIHDRDISLPEDYSRHLK